MADSKYKIIRNFLEYMGKGEDAYPDWYVGISKDARSRLFVGHRVKENGGYWIYGQAASSEVAREIEEHFVTELHTDGGTGGGDEEADQVYAFRKTPDTDPPSA